jgi:arsenate reductase
MPESQAAPMILFVCRHGAARSVLGEATLRSMARSRDVAIRARSAGVEPQERMSTSLAGLLPDDAAGLREARPRQVTAADLDEAWRTITFDIEPQELPAPTNRIDRWDGVPSVADDPMGAKLAIERRVAQLLDAIRPDGG